MRSESFRIRVRNGVWFVLSLCLLLVLAGCRQIMGRVAVALTTDDVTRLYMTIPVPSDARLLLIETREAGGSQEGCESVSVNGVYGSRRAFDETMKFYRARLLERGWTDVSSQYIHPVFRKDAHWSASVSAFSIEKDLLNLSEQNRKLIQAERQNYPRFYHFGVAYSVCSDQ